MTITLYDCAETDRTSGSGGSVRVAFSAKAGTNAAGTAYTGVFGQTAASIPCRYCRMQHDSANGGQIRYRIGSACTSVTGMAVPGFPTITPVAVSDLNKIYFWAQLSTLENLDIEYYG